MLLTLPTGGEAGGLTKEGRKIFEKTPATITASGAMHYLEAVWEFRGELFPLLS